MLSPPWNKSIFNTYGSIIYLASNRSVNESSPIVDARIPGSGERINVVLSPIALNGPILTIRRFPKEPITMDKLIHLGAVSEEVTSFLEKALKSFACGFTCIRLFAASIIFCVDL